MKNIKNVLIIILVLFLSFGLLSCKNNNENNKENNNEEDESKIVYEDIKDKCTFQYMSQTDTFELLSISGEISKNIEIPAYYEQKKVSSINYAAFNDYTYIEGIIISENITSISSSLDKLKNLKRISVKENNTVYDSRNNCNAIIETSTNTLVKGSKNTVIDSTVTSIGASAFRNLEGLTKIDIPSNIKNIGTYAFENCINLKDVTLNDTVIIAEYAFSGCTSITEIVLPQGDNSGCRNVNQGVFSGCTSLKKVTFNPNCATIENKAFENCTSLENIDFSNGIDYLCTSAFKGCTSLKEVNIKVNQTLGNMVFADCTSLESAIIDGSNSIINGRYLFDNCTSLTSVKIGSSISLPSDEWFRGCTSLKEITIDRTMAECEYFKSCCEGITFKCIDGELK